MRRRAKPAKAKVEGKSARTSPKTDNARVRDPEKRLAEALEQQKTTSEILNVISRSPTDVRPVLTASSNVLKVISRSTFDLAAVLTTLRSMTEKGRPI